MDFVPISFYKFAVRLLIEYKILFFLRGVASTFSAAVVEVALMASLTPEGNLQIRKPLNQQRQEKAQLAKTLLLN